MTGFFFANPWGLLALAGLPVILAIHFLQRRSRRVWINTGFLVRNESNQTLAGKRFERLRTSPPLWLQLLAVCMAAMALSQPRVIGQDTVQRVVVILDSSASMQAFADEALGALAETSAQLERAAHRTEWILLDSDPATPPLYTGGGRLKMLAVARENWEPLGGAPDFSRVLRPWRAQEGPVMVISDRAWTLPDGVALRAVGEPVENVGFTGGTVDVAEGVWRALVRNYSDRSVARRWWVESDAAHSQKARLEIAPGGTATLEGDWPGENLVVVLEPDRFTLDDRLPLVDPIGRDVAVAAAVDSRFAQRLVRSLPGLVPSGEPEAAEFHMADYNPLDPGLPPGPGMVFGGGPLVEGDDEPGPAVAGMHALVEDLDFSGLRINRALGIPPAEGDEVLVWVGNRRAVFLRRVEGGELLVWNFAPEASTVGRLPSAVVLAHRFLERVRETLPGGGRVHVTTGQRLATSPPDPFSPTRRVAEGEVREIPVGEPLMAPARPGFFAFVQDHEVVVEGAAYFGEVEQADFRNTESIDETGLVVRASREQGARGGEWTPAWIFLFLGALMAYWAYPWRLRLL